MDEPPHTKNGGICHTQLLVFQQLLPLPLSFKFSLFASSKKTGAAWRSRD
ncbi:hypothetical protein [Bradyrhizobium sp. AUGA SZCCT0431]|nr:hypothetical protein [Bradyrhizobium sp. AUGA SZCCT0431]MBR1144187.1 hypothetical protein [Bradyrhizobium sp. AUGA SZCCT0431]